MMLCIGHLTPVSGGQCHWEHLSFGWRGTRGLLGGQTGGQPGGESHAFCAFLHSPCIGPKPAGQHFWSAGLRGDWATGKSWMREKEIWMQ